MGGSQRRCGFRRMARISRRRDGRREGHWRAADGFRQSACCPVFGVGQLNSPPQSDSFYRWGSADVLILRLRICARSSADKFGDVLDDRLKVSITAPAVDGKANSHLIKFLAKQFGFDRRNKSKQDTSHCESGQHS